MSRYLLSDGRPVFRSNYSSNGLTSSGEPIFGLPPGGGVIWTEAPDLLAITATTSSYAGTANPYVRFDGLPIFRVGTTVAGIVSNGDMVFDFESTTASATIVWTEAADLLAATLIAEGVTHLNIAMTETPDQLAIGATAITGDIWTYTNPSVTIWTNQ